MKTKFLVFLSIALVLLTPTSCVNRDEVITSVTPGDSESLVISLNLTVPASALATRSENHGDDLGTEAERHIDVENEDYQILIFDSSGDAVDEEKLTDIKCTKNAGSGENVSYTLTATLSLSNEDREKLETFSVMVLANWMSFEQSNTQANYGYPSFAGYKVSGTDTQNVFNNGSDFNFTLKEQSNTWVPSMSDKLIPMFGIIQDLNLQNVIDMGKYGDDYCFTVPMLRALAKIEIVDMVPGEEAGIEKCILTAYNTSGRFIPDISGDNVNWGDKDIQIRRPSLPDNVATSADLQFYKTKKTVRTEGATEDEEKDYFVAYIPEMEVPDNAVINVKLGNQVYPIKLCDYDQDGKPIPGKEYESLLRNHSYRFDIIGVGSTELDFIVQTPWQKENAGEWGYDDLKIGFESGKEFRWDFSNYDPETKLPKFEKGDILNDRTIIITQDDWLEGIFRLISPVQAKWTISLYGDDNTLNDHFNVETGEKIKHEIDGEDYYTKEWNPGGPSVSGNVGEEVLFRIVPSAVNNSNDHYVARVVFTITTFDDQIIEVNLPYFNNKVYETEEMEMPMPTTGGNGYYYVKQYYSGFKDVEDNEPERPDDLAGE